ncbi:neo-calmodulin-like [Glandiceps talaboti]
MGCGGSKKTAGSEPKAEAAADNKQEEAPKTEGKVKGPKCTEDELTAKFKEADTDDSGYLTRDEIKKVLADIGEDGINDAEIDTLIEKIDKNDDGKVHYGEFYKNWKEACEEQKQEDVDRENIRKAFKNMDKDGNGLLTKEEVTQALKDCNAYEGNDQVQKMIDDADVDGDGKVRYEEFVNILQKEKDT